jgi:hypothetical protein
MEVLMVDRHQAAIADARLEDRVVGDRQFEVEPTAAGAEHDRQRPPQLPRREPLGPPRSRSFAAVGVANESARVCAPIDEVDCSCPAVGSACEHHDPIVVIDRVATRHAKVSFEIVPYAG